MKWQDVRPALPTINLKAAAKGEVAYDETARVPDVDPFDQAGFRIMVRQSRSARRNWAGGDWMADGRQATIADSGLGIVSWWAQQDGIEDAEMGEED